jgi:hypothetical protein
LLSGREGDRSPAPQYEADAAKGSAAEAPGTAALNRGKIAQITSVSCARPPTCAAGGYYADRSGHTQAFVGGEAR